MTNHLQLLYTIKCCEWKRFRAKQFLQKPTTALSCNNVVLLSLEPLRWFKRYNVVRENEPTIGRAVAAELVFFVVMYHNSRPPKAVA